MVGACYRYRSEYFTYILLAPLDSMDSYFRLIWVLVDGLEAVCSDRHFRNSFVPSHRHIFRINHSNSLHSTRQISLALAIIHYYWCLNMVKFASSFSSYWLISLVPFHSQVMRPSYSYYYHLWSNSWDDLYNITLPQCYIFSEWSPASNHTDPYVHGKLCCLQNLSSLGVKYTSIYLTTMFFIIMFNLTYCWRISLIN